MGIVKMITLGGNAELELVDSMDPFSEGIIFSVMPPKKSWKNISNLSGGEKVRLALCFSSYDGILIILSDAEFAGSRLRAACLQGEQPEVHVMTCLTLIRSAYAVVFHGRD